MIQKQILFCGNETIMACDGRCDKAWGINGRPKVMLSENEDDYVYKPDSELGTAPGPGETDCLEEGGHLKPSATPITDARLMNKWCARECERSSMFDPGKPVLLRDLDHPEPNIPRRTG